MKAVLLPLELNGLFKLVAYLHCRIRIQTPNLMDLMATLHCAEVFTLYTGLSRVSEMSGKNKIFSRSGKSHGILKKCQGVSTI